MIFLSEPKRIVSPATSEGVEEGVMSAPLFSNPGCGLHNPLTGFQQAIIIEFTSSQGISPGAA